MSKNTHSLWQLFKHLFTNPKHTSSIKASTQTSDTVNSSQPIHDELLAPETNASPSMAGASYTAVDISKLDSQVNMSFNEAEPSQSVEHIRTISAQQIEQILHLMGYQFLHHPSNPDDEQGVHHFTMQVADKEHEWGCMIRYFSQQQLIAIYSIFPSAVPEKHRGEMLAIITYLNYDLMIGNLEMDIADGELRFKTSLDLEVTGVDENVLSYLLQSNFSIFSRLYDTLDEMLKRANPTDDLNQAINELMLAQQAKTFYLLSERVQ